MVTDDIKQHAMIAGEITRLTATNKNRDFLRAMPVFGIDLDIPEAMLEMLERLDRVDRNRCHSSPPGR